MGAELVPVLDEAEDALGGLRHALEVRVLDDPPVDDGEEALNLGGSNGNRVRLWKLEFQASPNSVSRSRSATRRPAPASGTGSTDMILAIAFIIRTTIHAELRRSFHCRYTTVRGHLHRSNCFCLRHTWGNWIWKPNVLCVVSCTRS